MSATEPGSGWLPADALDDLEAARDEASRNIAEHFLGLPPRARVLALMGLADLARVLASFEGPDLPAAEELCRLFPGAVLDRA